MIVVIRRAATPMPEAARPKLWNCAAVNIARFVSNRADPATSAGSLALKHEEQNGYPSTPLIFRFVVSEN
jgi:hypothetical protein